MKKNYCLFVTLFAGIVFLVSCEDRTKEDQGTIDVPPIEINVSQAKEIGETLQYNESTKETYAVTGYVILADSYGEKIADSQRFYLSDDRTARKADLTAYYCKIASPGVVTGDKVTVTGKISNNFAGVRIEKGEACIVKEAVDFSISGTKDGHDYVDLGLSVKWATCNIGAELPTDIGNYYAWAETTPYTQWTYMNYKFSFAPCSPDYVLDAKYDAVTVNWGKSWRLPTRAEINELIKPENCDWIWVDNINETQTSGYMVVSKKNGKCIFLPAGKYIPHENYITPTEIEGHYWSSTTTHDVEKHPTQHSPFTIFFKNGIHYEGNKSCCDGLNVRGVVGSPNNYFPENTDNLDDFETQRQGISVSGKLDGYTYVDLGLPSLTLWATYNVGANHPGEYGNYYAWGETTTKDFYDQSTYKFYIGNSDNGAYHWAQYSKYIYNKDHGNPDYKLILDSEDDAATINWSNKWCMPTVEQVKELSKYCTWYRKDIEFNGQKVIGYIGESKLNNNKIYIPAAGWEYSTTPNTHMSAWYWTSELSGDNNGSGSDYRAYYFTFEDHGGMTVPLSILDTSRPQGLSVRGVVKQ